MLRSVRRHVFCLSQVVLAASALAVFTASAHDIVDPDWCTEKDHEPVIVERFAFDEKALQGLLERCGIVDEHRDDYQQASAAINYYCGVEADNRLGKPAPFVDGPMEFVAKEHHELYRIKMGLTGSCVVCVKKL